VKSLLNKLWNFDFYSNHKLRVGSGMVFFIAILIAIGYPLVEVLFAVGNASSTFSIFSYAKTIQSGKAFSLSYKTFEELFPHIWIMLALFCVSLRIASIVHSYVLSKKELGEDRFKKVFFTGLSSFIIGTAGGLIILFLFGVIAYATGIGEKWQGNPISYSVEELTKFIHNHVPSLLHVQNYWLAFVLTVFLIGLPGYFGHWLSHKTRFFWLVTHRAHHVMEYLYPTSAAPAFNFDFLLHLPSAFLGMVVSQLIYTEPLVMEMILWSTFSYSFEVFNHSIAHYQFCYSNPVIRNITRFFGGLGVYHLVHHSAYPEDQNINLGGTPFNFWDRVFGTYRKPYKEAPPLGLTNQPDISWSPMRITFNGIAQLIYEWRMNKDWFTRFKIIFGSIWYNPPYTKDFLLENSK
jgi:sterol desaturase/sphingolipid hydroxylase (fatty acid hydroxylase superfamily)